MFLVVQAAQSSAGARMRRIVCLRMTRIGAKSCAEREGFRRKKPWGSFRRSFSGHLLAHR